MRERSWTLQPSVGMLWIPCEWKRASRDGVSRWNIMVIAGSIFYIFSIFSWLWTRIRLKLVSWIWLIWARLHYIDFCLRKSISIDKFRADLSAMKHCWNSKTSRWLKNWFYCPWMVNYPQTIKWVMKKSTTKEKYWFFIDDFIKFITLFY